MPTPRQDDAPGPRMAIGLAIPAIAGLSLDDARDHCLRLGVSLVNVTGARLERLLAAPVPMVPLDPPPDDGLEFGLLELEEEVLRDSYDLAKQSFDAQMRAWRSTVSASPLADRQTRWAAAGLAVHSVAMPDLVVWSDEEVAYACRLARAAGARVLETGVSLAGPRRLAPVARRHDIRLSFTSDANTGGADLNRILDQDGRVAVALDIGAWVRGGHGSPLPWLLSHADRISHVYLDARAPAGAMASDGEVGPPFADVLRAMRDRHWAFPIVVTADPRWTPDEWRAGTREAVRFCQAIPGSA